MLIFISYSSSSPFCKLLSLLTVNFKSSPFGPTLVPLSGIIFGPLSCTCLSFCAIISILGFCPPIPASLPPFHVTVFLAKTSTVNFIKLFGSPIMVPYTPLLLLTVNCIYSASSLFDNFLAGCSFKRITF